MEWEYESGQVEFKVKRWWPRYLSRLSYRVESGVLVSGVKLANRPKRETRSDSKTIAWVRLYCAAMFNASRAMQSKALRIFLLAVILLVVLMFLWVWLTLHWSYSEGDRAGYVQKLSKKGWICKTWEGEIAMVTMPGAIPEKFDFTVPDDAIANRINAMAGKRVVLHYEQHKLIPSSCFAETEYFVTTVRELTDQSSTQTMPATPQGQLQTPR